MIFLVDVTRVDLKSLCDPGTVGFPELNGALLVPFIPGPNDEFPPIMKVSEADRDLVEAALARKA